MGKQKGEVKSELEGKEKGQEIEKKRDGREKERQGSDLSKQVKQGVSKKIKYFGERKKILFRTCDNEFEIRCEHQLRRTTIELYIMPYLF